MKNLITYLKTLWGAYGNSQSKDVRHDCRLTVGSPSGLDAKWKQNPFMRFAVVLTLIFTIGSGNVWGEDLTTADLNFGTAAVTETFESVNTVSTSGKSGSTTTVTNYTTYGIFTHGYIGKSTSDNYSIKSAATPMTSKYLEISTTTKGAGMSFSRTFATKGAFSFKIATTSATFIGLYGAVANSTIYAKANSSVYLYFTGSKIQINNGSGWIDAVTSLPSTTTLDITVVYNNTTADATYGNNVSLGAKKAHIFVNGTAVMDGSSPKAFTIPGANLTAFRIMYNNAGTSKVDDIKIYDALPTAAASGWKLKGEFDSWGDGYAMTGSGTVSVTRSLAANTRYEFKIYNGETAYGNNGAIVHSISDWTFATDKNNCVLYTGPAGDYTFSINTSTKATSVTYPSVTHPNANYVYIKKGAGWSDARIYNWDSGSSSKMSDWAGSPVLATCEICDETYYYGAAYFNKIIFRDGGSNQSNEVSLDRGKWLDETTHADSWSTFDKYTISYDKGTGTGGSMSSHTNLCPGSSQALSANAFTKDHYHFTGWKADVNVTINSATVTAGTLITGTPTIENVQSNITLTAQWEVNSNTLTWNWGGGSTTSTSYTLYPATNGSVNYGTTITYPANGTMSKTGYDFSSWSSSATSMPDEALTITASWTAKTYTITYKDQGGDAFSGTQTDPPTSHTYGTSTTLKIPTKAGYIFGGWFTSSDCTSGAVGTPSAASLGATDYIDNIILYAKWTDKGCTDHAGTNVVSGASTGYTYGPVNPYYEYSTREILYTKTDLGLAAGKKGTIKSIYFEYAYASAMTGTNSVKIYMANTDLAALSNSNYITSFTEVYSGALNCSNGWNEVTLTTPFDYNGTGNLIVVIDDNSNKDEGSSAVFKYHEASTTTGAQVYTQSPSTNADPTAAATWTGATATNYRPNTKFCIQEADMTPATVTLKDDNSPLTETSAGAGVTLPSRAGCTEYTFAGWTKTWTEEQDEWTTTAPTIIPAGTYHPSSNENLYPVYTKTEGGGSTDVTIVPGTFSDKGTNNYGSGTERTGEVDGISFGGHYVTGNQANAPVNPCTAGTYLQCQANNANIYNKSALSGKITKVVLNQYSAQSFSLYCGTEQLMATDNTSTSQTPSGTKIDDITAANSMTWNVSGNYTYFDIKKNTGAAYITSIVVTYSGSTTSYISVPNCCTDWSTPTVTYSSSLAINASEEVTIGSGTVHGAVTYESSDEDVLTVDADGTIHAVGAGTAHIIATWAGDATYCEKSANSNDVTVSGIQVTGTTPVNFGQVYQNAVIADKTIAVTGLELASAITPSLPAGSPFSFSPASLAKDCSGATLTISASTATLGTYNQTLTLTSGTFSATVTVKMEVIAMPTATFTDALHGLTEDEDGVSLSSYNLTAAQGTPVVFPTLANQTKSAGTCEGEYYIFVGWTEGDNNTDPQDHLVTSHTLANGDVKNYYAVWADASGSATYTKLTSDDFKTSPTKYVLGGEDNGTKYFLYTYSSTDADLSWGECSSSEAPIQFTLSGAAGTLVAQDASGNYLAESSAKKKFRMSSTSATVQLQDDGTIETVSFYLRYNHNSGSGGLRYYESESSEPAYFYEVSAGGTVHYRTSCCANKVDAPVVTATAVTSTSITLTWPSDVKATGWQIEWNGAGGWVTPSGSCTHTVSGLTPNTTYTWRVRATYEDPVCGADVRSGSTTTHQVYHVTYAKGSGTGTCTATGSTTDATAYEAGATVTLQANGFTLSGHTFAGWTEDDEDVTISNNQFTMPEHDVVITASWTAKMDKYFDRMHDQTDSSHGGVAETEGTNEGKYYIAKTGCSYSAPTAVDSNTGDACQTTHYKLRGWIAASYVNAKGEITDESKIFSPGTTKTAGGYTYYAVWAEVTE